MHLTYKFISEMFWGVVAAAIVAFCVVAFLYVATV